MQNLSPSSMCVPQFEQNAIGISSRVSFSEEKEVTLSGLHLREYLWSAAGFDEPVEALMQRLVAYFKCFWLL